MATELAAAYVQIIPSAEGIKGSITKVLGGEADNAGRSAGSSIAGKIKGVIAAAGIGAALKNAIMEGAALEQSIGGIETLFKDSADTVKQYAANAYKTAGLSANEYMESVTGFSASLLQGLGGDTAKAAEIADMALTDMSDNANKMGTDMTSIQNAYQGFAKQNYTMLDNLKLGYGGTKTEMERLLADAQKLTGVKYDIDNLSDVYSAIHEIQKELGIMDATREEAVTTLSGSLASMKAAFKNVLGNLTLGQDIAPALSALVETTKTFLVGNLLPAVGNIIKALPTVVGTLGPELFSEIMTAIPQMTQAGVQLMQGLGDGFVTGIPQLLEKALPALLQFTTDLRANFGTLVDAGIDLIMKLADGLIAGLPTMIATIPQIITNIAGLINDNAPKILAAGIQLIGKLAMGLIQAIPDIIAALPKIFEAIVSVFTAFNWIDLGHTVIKGIVGGLNGLAHTISSSFTNFIHNAAGIVKNFGWASLGRGIIQALVNGVYALASLVPNALRSAGQSALTAFQSIDWLGLGKNIIKGIAAGITGSLGTIVDAAKEAARSALNAAKKFLGIHSPSRIFADQVGRFIPAGMAEGIEANVKSVQDAMNNMTRRTVDTWDIDSAVQAGKNVSMWDGAAGQTSSTYMGGVTINVYAAEGQSEREIAERVDEILENKHKRFTEAYK